jgi:AAA+ ATPase superfamily predicted ATPase
MFVGRKNELTELERLYRTEVFQCVIIYGRRRVGKTALISEFVKDKDTVFFTAQETTAKENLENFSQSIFRLSNDFQNRTAVFTNFDDAVDTVFSFSENRRIVLVVDEYPYLASSYKGISSMLQKFIDMYKETSKLFIILCGSSLSFMENQVLGYQSPLYGRRTAQFKILPFDYAQTREYFAETYNALDTALLHGITGGVPLYMSLIDKQLSVSDNIKLNFLTPSGYLFEEPGNLIKQECREPAHYNAIIKAIAGGASRLSEISSKVGLETSVCSTYITKLISIGIIKKEFPFREETSKKTIYALADSMFRFWYRFIPDCVSLITRGEANLAYDLIQPQLPAFMGMVFEEICKQYLWQQNISRKTPILFTDAGRWWGSDPRKRTECEIDIIADNKEDAIFAECKWTNEPVKIDVLETLVERSELFQYNRKHFYLFSKAGFSQSCSLKAKEMGNVTLVSFEDM